MFLTILISLISFFALIVLHEFGHFIMAKRFGVEVEEFGVGYPPRLFGKKFGETIYSVNLIPFGAFVRVKGETGGVENYRSFVGKKMWQRMLIILGGVVSFWIISAVLLSIVAGVWGLPVAVSDDENYNLKNAHVQIISVLPDSPAQTAGLQVGDNLVGFEKMADFQQFVKINQDEEITLTVKRGNDVYEKKIIPGLLEGQEGKLIGVALARVAFRTYPWYKAPFKGVSESWSMTGQIIGGWVLGVKNMLGLASLPEGMKMDMLGPLGIFNLLREYASLGASYFLSLISLISVGLALSNILPIPALDGGKMVFLAIEFFKGSPVNYKIEQKITAVFFIVLILLMVFITFKFDIPRIF